MCKRFMIVILVLGVLFAPAVAFADDFGGSDGGDFSDQIVYGPSAIDVLAQRFGVQVYSGNKFNAALCALGYDPYSSVFTSDVKAYLSNASTGGAFYDFADLFQHDLTYFGVDPLGVTWSSALAVNNGLYGKESVWCAVYEESLFNSAKERVQEALNGNTGGGSGGNDGAYEGNYQAPDTLTFTMSNFVSADTYKQYSYGYSSTPNLPTETLNASFTVTLNDTVKNRLNSTGQTYSYATFVLWRNSRIYKDAGVTVNCYLSENAPVINGTTNITISGKYASLQFETSNVTTNGENNLTVTRVYDLYNQNNGTTFAFSRPAYVIGAGVGEPVVPPTQWPEPDPVTPTEPPEVPDPPTSDPVSDPTNVNIGIPQLPNIGLTTEPTYQTADIASILDAMGAHCQHLQTCMTECFDSYYSSITQFEKSLQENTKEFQRSWFRVMLDTIRDCFDDLSDYLQRLFTWLADQMDFTFTGGDFDDSSIVWWLKRIYSKLGSGTTVRPTDPVVDPKGIGDWFDQLIKNFVLDLLALGQDFLADVVEMFRQLTTKFPISIPWDIVAILTLFAAEPETPVFNIPQYALTGANTISQVGTYVIDMQDYDGVMSVVRNVEKVVFAFWLCWKIDFFKQAFDIMTGGK